MATTEFRRRVPTYYPENLPAECRDEKTPIVRGLFSWLLERFVPIGYEDEQGFHYGEPPHP